MRNSLHPVSAWKGSLWHVCLTVPHTSGLGLAIQSVSSLPAQHTLCTLHSCQQHPGNARSTLNTMCFRMLLLLAELLCCFRGAGAGVGTVGQQEISHYSGGCGALLKSWHLLSGCWRLQVGHADVRSQLALEGEGSRACSAGCVI